MKWFVLADYKNMSMFASSLWISLEVVSFESILNSWRGNTRHATGGFQQERPSGPSYGAYVECRWVTVGNGTYRYLVL